MKLFGTDGIRGKFGNYPFDIDGVKKIGAAFAQFLGKGKKTIVVAKDTRASSSIIEESLSAGLKSRGADVLLLGVIPTNALSYLTSLYKATGGVMITASHNPAEDNGLKFFSSIGTKLSDADEEEIEQLFFSELPKSPLGQVLQINGAKEQYAAHLLSGIPNPIEEKIVVDCANGAGSFVAKDIFKNGIIINNKPDGMNINKECGALFPDVVSKAVKKSKAAMGLALDGDADRAIFCDEKGKILDGDQYMAIIATHLNRKELLKKSTLVVTGYSNSALDEEMKNEGISVVRVANGDRYVFEEMTKSGYNFGGEKSGHYIFLDYAKGGDGLLNALQLLKIMKETGNKLSELATLKPFPQILKNIAVKEKKPLEATGLMSLAKSLEPKIGRIFIRYSGTENLLRIMAEGKDEKALKKAVSELESQAKKELM
jgi:phosphoglucosamine mutase